MPLIAISAPVRAAVLECEANLDRRLPADENALAAAFGLGLEVAAEVVVLVATWRYSRYLARGGASLGVEELAAHFQIGRDRALRVLQQAQGNEA
ncbi:hypothetical protein [Streptosporangium sp. NPDC051022]|uniref:hypothetical protein n=1 Tax=Streptosporangium sp. NPDC051022 TaxID=3155752 RepID=UPI0034460223